jgi:hypothetical protein
MVCFYEPLIRRFTTLTETVVPTWVKYAGDIFFLVFFLVVLFCFKADPTVETPDQSDDTDQPNPLEKMLVSDQDPDEPEK